MAEDFGYAFATAAEAWSWLSQAREMHPDGKRWQVLESQKGDCAKALYTLLSDVPVNDNDELESDFLHFDKGTHRYDVWHWLEHEYGVTVAEL
ncbi:hypothetical protein [Vibrio sp. Hal054]|uniref:hypothetical protein n=1 Tax=Vibrio sp. Hal054 TaxID=3035158 RepID=UPI00301C6685